MATENYWTRRSAHQSTRRRALAGMGATGAGLAAILAAGCGSDDDKPAATASSGGGGGIETAGTATPRPKQPRDIAYAREIPASGTPKRGGTFKNYLNLTVPSVDPLKNAAKDAAYFHGLHSSTLIAHTAEPGAGKFYDEPLDGDIANKWEQPDATTFVFKLNPKAKWNNRPPANGRAVTPDDVKFSFERLASGGATKARFSTVGKIESVDSGTLRITLTAPTPEMLDVFAFEFHPIVNKEYLDSKGGDMGDGGTSYVGTGPFMITSWSTGTGAEWARNPDYHGTDKAGQQLPYVDKVTYPKILDPIAQQAAFESGQLDLTSLAIDDFAKFAKRDDAYMIKGQPASGQNILAMNLRKDPFKDARVRKAISMAVDRKAMNEQGYQGISSPSFPYPPKALGRGPFTFDDLPDTHRSNPAEAKKLLEAAGFGKGLDLTLWYWNLNQGWLNQALMMQDFLKKVGVNANLQVIDRSKFLEQLFAGSWDGLMHSHSTVPGVTDQSWADWVESTAGNNYWGIKDDVIDGLVKKLRTELDAKARIALFKQLTDRELGEAYRAWMLQLTGISAYKKTVHNPIATSFLEYKEFAVKYVWMG